MSSNKIVRREFNTAITARAEESDSGERSVIGVAVPYGEWTEIFPGFMEQFAEGAAIISERGNKLFWQHRDPIGKIESSEQTAVGLEIVGRISKTALGDEAYTLAQDGVVNSFSVGFIPGEWEDRVDDEENVYRTITRAEVMEVSLVNYPAYSGAEVNEVRSSKNQAKESSKMESEEIREAVDVLERRLTVIENSTNSGSNEVPFNYRSIGEYAKALAAGEEAAARAYEGATTANTVMQPAWLGNLTELMAQKQPIINLFGRSYNLPASGNSVEYAQLKEDATKVAKQENEGDDLVKGHVKLETKQANIGTYGGWTELSRQAIERASIPFLDTTFEAMALKYAKEIETLGRETILGIYEGEATAATLGLGAPLASADADAWTKMLIKLGVHFDGLPVGLSGLLVSPDVFERLAAIEEKRKFLQVSNAPSDKGGTISITGLSGEIASLRVDMLPTWTGQKAMAYSTRSLTVMESPGAPLRLQDENIVNLTKSYSVYGYGAAFSTVPSGIVPLKMGA